MIRLLYTELLNLPEPEELAKALPDSFRSAYLKAHKKPTTAGLGGLWLAAAAGASGSLSYDEKGRPNLTDRAFSDLSISHTGRFVFCALASGEHHRVGLDVEDGARLDGATVEKLARRFFEADEVAKIESAEDPKEAFLAIWTKKEAYAKYTGEGLASLLAGKNPERSCYFISASGEGGRVTICSDSPFETGFPEAKRVEFFVKHG